MSTTDRQKRVPVSIREKHLYREKVSRACEATHVTKLLTGHFDLLELVEFCGVTMGRRTAIFKSSFLKIFQRGGRLRRPVVHLVRNVQKGPMLTIRIDYILNIRL